MLYSLIFEKGIDIGIDDNYILDEAADEVDEAEEELMSGGDDDFILDQMIEDETGEIPEDQTEDLYTNLPNDDDDEGFTDEELQNANFVDSDDYGSIDCSDPHLDFDGADAELVDDYIDSHI